SADRTREARKIGGVRVEQRDELFDFAGKMLGVRAGLGDEAGESAATCMEVTVGAGSRENRNYVFVAPVFTEAEDMFLIRRRKGPEFADFTHRSNRLGLGGAAGLSREAARFF